MPEWFRQSKRKPLHASRIEDYAIIGDLETAALVSREGSIDWLCWPTFASGACFAALLGTAENGYWSLRPAGKITSIQRRYRPGTLILETTFTTPSGELLLTDFMPPRGNHSDVIRTLRCTRGKVALRMELILRFDYGLTVPWVTTADQELRAVAGPNMVVLRTECTGHKPVELRGENLKTISEFTMREGQQHCFVLTYAPSTEEVPDRVPIEAAFNDTETFWLEWIGRSKYTGPCKDIVERSLLTLKALTYHPTGGIVAAATAGLPEHIGGGRNWDYRYCWLRDTAFTLLVLIRAGYTDEAVRWRLWLLRAIAGTPGQLQTLYGISGERKLVEWEATWLPGYENSRPVRIGNAASEQFQLDVYGEIGVALSRIPDADEDIRVPASELQAHLMDHLCNIWHLPDEGIWEVRGGRKHFVHSKVMAWVALDRAIKNHERLDGCGNVELWRKNRDAIHAEVCKKGFNKRLNSFTQSYDSTNLDASCLRIALVGFLPPDDPRIIGTVEAIQRHLIRDGLVERYNTSRTSDGLRGGEGAFLACSFWLVSCLWLIGRHDEATQLFERLLSLTNDVGLLSEEYDAKNCRMLGNFPQALSHIALAHAAFTLSGYWKPEPYSASS